MQLEWNRWVEGITTFKMQQGLFLVLLPILFLLFFKEKKIKNNTLMIALLLLCAVVLMPITAIVLLKIFTPFYDWLDLQQLLQLPLLMGVLGVLLTEILLKVDIHSVRIKSVKFPIHAVFCVCCVMLLFLVGSGFRAFDKKSPTNENGVPLESADAFDALYELVEEEAIVIAAPAKLLEYVRLYEPGWIPLYGRDLWDGKAAGYINSGYEVEYDYYTFLERAELNPEERPDFAALLLGGHADCIIVPYYWREDYCPAETYTLLSLTAEYNVIIKKELVHNE